MLSQQPIQNSSDRTPQYTALDAINNYLLGNELPSTLDRLNTARGLEKSEVSLANKNSFVQLMIWFQSYLSLRANDTAFMGVRSRILDLQQELLCMTGIITQPLMGQPITDAIFETAMKQHYYMWQVSYTWGIGLNGQNLSISLQTALTQANSQRGMKRPSGGSSNFIQNKRRNRCFWCKSLDHSLSDCPHNTPTVQTFTRVCHAFNNGTCRYGLKCHYVHICNKYMMGPYPSHPATQCIAIPSTNTA